MNKKLLKHYITGVLVYPTMPLAWLFTIYEFGWSGRETFSNMHQNWKDTWNEGPQ